MPKGKLLPWEEGYSGTSKRKQMAPLKKKDAKASKERAKSKTVSRSEYMQRSI